MDHNSGVLLAVCLRKLFYNRFSNRHFKSVQSDDIKNEMQSDWKKIYI